EAFDASRIRDERTETRAQAGTVKEEMQVPADVRDEPAGQRQHVRDGMGLGAEQNPRDQSKPGRDAEEVEGMQSRGGQHSIDPAPNAEWQPAIADGHGELNQGASGLWGPDVGRSTEAVRVERGPDKRPAVIARFPTHERGHAAIDPVAAPD